MLIIALVLALIGLVALVAAVVTSNELIAWVCIGASVIGVLLLIADALRSRRDGNADVDAADADEDEQGVQDYPEEADVTEPDRHDSEAVDADTEVAGVTDTQDESQSEPGGAVEVSPDPEETPKS